MKEAKLLVCRKHWSAFIIPGILAVVLLIAFVPLALIPVLYILIEYKTYYVALTETKVVGHKGFIRSKTLSTPISKVQDISLENGLFGKMFGYHTVCISNSGSDRTEFVFKQMGKAVEFVDAVQNKM